MSIDPKALEQHFAALCDLEAEARTEALEKLAAQDAELARRLAALLDMHDSNPIDLNQLAEQELRGLGTFETDQLAGRELDGWKLIRELGRGGLGVVYAAERVRSGVHERAAIKLLQVPAMDARVAQRFLHEAAVLARLSHPGICRLRDWGRSQEGWQYLVLDLIEGQRISEAARKLDLAQRIELVARLADTLGAAHRQLVVHLDIKPDNVLVDERGRPILLDFGVARVLREESNGTTTLARGMTLDYASPEQIKGAPASVPADLYALGALLYELVTGKRPFNLSKCTLPDALSLIDRGAKPPSRLVAKAGRDLDAVIAKAMHADPARRYESAAAFADDLRAIVARRPVKARPDTLAYRLSRLVQRNPIAAPLATASILAIALLAGMLALQAEDLREERDNAKAQATRARAASDLLLGAIESADPTGQQASAATVDEMLNAAARRIDETAQQDPVLAIESLIQIADARESLGEFETAINLYRGALERLDAELAEGPDTARELRINAVTGLVSALRQTSRFDEANELLAAETPQDGHAGHWKLLVSQANLALAQGQTEQAEHDLQRALATLPESAHASRASILNSLGYIPAGVGRYADALDWYRRAEQAARRAPVDREMLATILLNIANSESKLGNIEAALAAAGESLELRIDMFAEAHTRTVPSVMIHAYVYMEAGRWDEGIAAGRRAAEIEQQLNGGDTMRMAGIWSAIGLAAERKGDRETARDAFERALEVQRRLLPANHPALAGTQVNLASTMMAAGDYAGSLAPLTQAWEIHTKAAAGKPSRSRAIAAVNIAYCHIKLDQPEQALPWAADALEEAEQVLNPDQWLLGHFRNVHAEALFMNGELDQARHEALAVEQVYTASTIPVRPESVQENLDLLARIFQATGDPDRSDDYQSRLEAPEPAAP